MSKKVVSRMWTRAEDRTLKHALRSGLDYEAAAAQLGRTVDSVASRANRRHMGIRAVRPYPRLVPVAPEVRLPERSDPRVYDPPAKELLARWLVFSEGGSGPEAARILKLQTRRHLGWGLRQ